METKKEKRNVPSLRFPENTDDWGQRKFSEFTYDAGKRNKDNLELEPYAITNDRGFIPQSEAHDEFGYMQNTDRTAYNIVKPNSFVYNPARINVGSIGYYDGKNDVIVSSLYEVFQTTDYVDDRFLWHWLKSENLPRWIGRLQEGSVRLYFYYDKLCECHLMLPSLKEQKLIAKFFDNLDNTIILHQRKLESIKEYKKGMLQKMFPKEGKNVPEMRFSGFTSDWKQYRLSALMDFSNGFNGNSAFYGKGIPYISVMDILNNDFITYECIRGRVNIDKNTLERFAVNYGDVLFQRSSENVEDAGSSNVYLSKKTAAFGGFVIRGKKKTEYDGFFIKNLLDSEMVRKQITSKAQGAQHINISQETLSGVVVSIPSMEEQVSVGKLFASINKTITLHQRKLDELKELKKGLLQQMFI